MQLSILLVTGALFFVHAVSQSTTTASPRPGSNTEKLALCFPTNSSSKPDLKAPCNTLFGLATLCSYGPNDPNGNGPPKSPADQQKCYCQGDGASIFQNLAGCYECQRLHGIPDLQHNGSWYPAAYVQVQSSQYCALASPTQALEDFLGNWTASATVSVGTSTGGTDVLGTATDVSLYFTTTPIGAPASTSSGTGVTTATTSAITTGAIAITTGSIAASTSIPAATTASKNVGSTVKGCGIIGAFVWGVAAFL